MNVFTFIKNIIYPPRCVFCDFMMEPNDENDFCGKCAESITFCNESICCNKCGKPIISFGKKQICYFCLNRRNRYFDRIVSVFEYSGVVKSSILQYKGTGVRKNADVYARIMLARMGEEYKDIKFDFICPTPSHKNHKVDKGFDHTEEICRRLSAHTGIRYRKKVLVKIRQTEKQKSLNYEKRMKNLAGSMIVKPGSDLGGKTILLVDDICTTRATAIECAKTLKKGGAGKVYVLTLATTLKSE